MSRLRYFVDETGEVVMLLLPGCLKYPQDKFALMLKISGKLTDKAIIFGKVWIPVLSSIANSLPTSKSQVASRKSQMLSPNSSFNLCFSDSRCFASSIESHEPRDRTCGQPHVDGVNLDDDCGGAMLIGLWSRSSSAIHFDDSLPRRRQIEGSYGLLETLEADPSPYRLRAR